MRPKFETRTIFLRSQVQRDTLLALIPNLPLDVAKPLMVTIETFKEKRKLDANAAYWAGPLRDISQQAWLDGRQFSPEVLHEYFKEQFLPEEYIEDECLKGYRKWEFDPAGNRKLVGTSTMLTKKGFAIFMEQVTAFGASLGVQFSVNPNEVK